MSFVVTALQLNLRSAPDPGKRNNIIVTLAQGTRVDKVADAARPGWWEVETSPTGVTLRGFINSSFVADEQDVEHHDIVGTAGGLAAAELAPSASAKRAGAGGRAAPLGEAGQPGPPSSHPDGPVAGIHAVVDWLGVGDPDHLRWQRQGSTTFCNVYAYDLARACGAYLPRVWWSDGALARIRNGEKVQTLYADTVFEKTANSIFDWFQEHGATFGWTRSFDPDEFQIAVNSGRIGIINAQRVKLDSPGHIQGTLPEMGQRQAKRDTHGRVTLPLQSNAGVTNFDSGFMGSTQWWTAAKFRQAAFWHHAVA